LLLLARSTCNTILFSFNDHENFRFKIKKKISGDYDDFCM